VKLKLGDPAPDFSVVDHRGRRVKLADFLGNRTLILYFYPKDFTSVCTAESCGFRDLYAGFASSQIEVIGVSLDSADSHRRFAERYALPFSLVSDTSRTLTRTYGALSSIRSLLGLAKRVTYVIDLDGKIAGVFEGELNALTHVEGVRDLVKKLAAA